MGRVGSLAVFLDGAVVETPLCWSGLFGLETGNNVKNQWNEAEAAACGDDPLAMRVYSSRLIGREAALVLHGGGNTSVKAPFTDMFGEVSEVLFVKGSGWDLATIERPGFAPVRLTVLSLKRRSQRFRLKNQAMPDSLPHTRGLGYCLVKSMHPKRHSFRQNHSCW